MVVTYLSWSHNNFVMIWLLFLKKLPFYFLSKFIWILAVLFTENHSLPDNLLLAFLPLLLSRHWLLHSFTILGPYIILQSWLEAVISNLKELLSLHQLRPDEKLWALSWSPVRQRRFGITPRYWPHSASTSSPPLSIPNSAGNESLFFHCQKSSPYMSCPDFFSNSIVFFPSPCTLQLIRLITGTEISQNGTVLRIQPCSERFKYTQVPHQQSTALAYVPLWMAANYLTSLILWVTI